MAAPIVMGATIAVKPQKEKDCALAIIITNNDSPMLQLLLFKNSKLKGKILWELSRVQKEQLNQQENQIGANGTIKTPPEIRHH